MHNGLVEEDLYVLETSEEELMEEPVEMIREWLSEIMIARGGSASARLDSLRDRGEITHIIPTLPDAGKRFI